LQREDRPWWINRFNKYGVAGLEEGPREAHPRVYGPEDVGAVIQAALAPTQELGLPFASSFETQWKTTDVAFAVWGVVTGVFKLVLAAGMFASVRQRTLHLARRRQGLGKVGMRGYARRTSLDRCSCPHGYVSGVLGIADMFT
jgi:hypothetical protein